MKKENLNNITENIKSQEEKVMNKKNYELRKFTDEESFNYQDKLPELYEKRAHIVNTFYENYVLGAVKETEKYKKYEAKKAAGFKLVGQVMEMSGVIMNYLTEFVTTARGWKALISILECNPGAFSEGMSLYWTVSDAISMATFAVGGKYKKINVKYSLLKTFKTAGDYEELQPQAAYVKTGEYNAETKEIEVYIPEEYEMKSIDRWLREHDAGDMYEMFKEWKKEQEENLTAESEAQEENDMKKEMIIDMATDTYEIVGAGRTLENCRGIDDGQLEDAARYIFGNSDEEEEENKEMLINYYKNQPKEFFEEFTDDDMTGEGLVGRMARDLMAAKADAPELDFTDWELPDKDIKTTILYRAEFLHTFKNLFMRGEIKEQYLYNKNKERFDVVVNDADMMNEYLTNFLNLATTWQWLFIHADGFDKLINKFYGMDGKWIPMLHADPMSGIDEPPEHMMNWNDHVSAVTAWLYDMAKISGKYGFFNPAGDYRLVAIDNNTSKGRYKRHFELQAVREETESSISQFSIWRFDGYPDRVEKECWNNVEMFILKIKYERNTKYDHEPEPEEFEDDDAWWDAFEDWQEKVKIIGYYVAADMKPQYKFSEYDMETIEDVFGTRDLDKILY